MFKVKGIKGCLSVYSPFLPEPEHSPFRGLGSGHSAGRRQCFLTGGLSQSNAGGQYGR